MEEIKAEEYVRTKDGKFGVFDRYSSREENSLHKSPFNCFIKMQNRKTPLQCSREYIVKHSKNLIDLIEIGDFVNQKCVKKIKDDEKCIIYEKCLHGYAIRTQIYFNKVCHTVCGTEIDEDYEFNEPLAFSVEELQAIYKKCEELKWI